MPLVFIISTAIGNVAVALALIVRLLTTGLSTSRSGKTLDEANELGRLTGMKAYFAKGIDYDGSGYGVAVLSKLPMEGMRRIQLPYGRTLQGGTKDTWPSYY
jgi:hypothetical protein